MAIYRQTWTITHPALGGIGTNTWHCETAGAPADDDGDVDGPSAFITSFYGALNDIYAEGSVIACDGLWISVHDDKTVNSSSDPTTMTLGVATTTLAPQDCLVASWRTAVASKSGRGRTFLGPLNLGALEANGTPAEFARTAIVAAGNALISDSNEGDVGVLGVYSTKQDLLRPFTGVSCKNKFGTLRSRRD